jgi:hypothetical protein
MTNLVTGLILLAFSILYWLGADAIPKSSLSGGVGADGLPKLLAIALGLLALVLVLQSAAGLRRSTPTTEMAEREPGPKPHLLALAILGIGILYAVILPYAGYLVAAAALLLAMALFYGRRLSAPVIAFAIVGAIGFHLLFVTILDVDMPEGPIEALFSQG